MALITPVGKSDFEWSPKEGEALVKTASTSEQTTQADDKQALYEAAKKYLEAQKKAALQKKAADECKDKKPGECKDEKKDKPEEKMEKTSDDVPEGLKDESEDAEAPKMDEAPTADEGSKADVQQAVAELVEKSEKAEEVAAKVEQAVEKVEEAVQGVRDAVGGEVADLKDEIGTEEVALDIGGEGAGDMGGMGEVPEEVELEINVDGDMGTPAEDEIVQQSCGTAMAKADKALKLHSVAKSKDDFEKISKISPQTRSKVLTYWTKYLKYEPDYCKLLVKNYEK